MAELLSGGIRFTGLASGSDFDQMIDQLKKVESVQMNRMELWKADWQRRVDAFGEINTLMSELKTTLSSMDTTSEFMSKSASSSSETVASASPGATALEGSYVIDVYQLAFAGSMTTNTTHGVDEKSSIVNSSGGTQVLEYTYGGTTRSLDVANGTTLESLINMINKDSQNPGVHASAMKAGDKYVLHMQGKETGADHDLTINTATTTLTIAQGNLAHLTAQDAKYKLNGFPLNEDPNPDGLAYDASNAATWTYMTSSSNTLTEAIEGVDVTLKTNGSTQITVATDTTKVKENIEKFVEDMNKVRTKIMELTSVDSKKTATDPNKSASQFSAEIGSVLTGNYGVQLLSSRLKQITAGQPAGFDYRSQDGLSGDIYSTLSQVGILTVADEGDPNNGLLTIDYEVLDKALKDNPNDVASLFAADGVGGTNSGSFSYVSHIQNVTAAGSYDVNYEVDAGGNVINATINGNPAKYNATTKELTAYGSNPTYEGGVLSGFGTGPERGLVVRVDDFTQGTYSGEAQIKMGKLGEINTMVTNSLKDDGTLKIIENNYEDIMDEIDKKIERETERITRWERHMRLRFARLEATLSTLNGQMQSLNSQMSQLNK